MYTHILSGRYITSRHPFPPIGTYFSSSSHMFYTTSYKEFSVHIFNCYKTLHDLVDILIMSIFLGTVGVDVVKTLSHIYVYCPTDKGNQLPTRITLDFCTGSSTLQRVSSIKTWYPFKNFTAHLSVTAGDANKSVVIDAKVVVVMKIRIGRKKWSIRHSWQ